MIFFSGTKKAEAAFAFVQTINDCFTTAGNGNTMTSWSPQANEILLLAVYVLNEDTAVTNVAGNGLTWTQVADVDNARAVGGVTVFRASSASTPSSGSITFDHNTAKPALAFATRISGGDRTTNDGVEASNTAPGGVTDNDDMLVSLTTVTNAALAVGLGGQRGSGTFTPGADETEIFESSADCGASGSRIRGNLWHITNPVDPAATVELGQANSLGAAQAWTAVGVSIKPAATASSTYDQRVYRFFENTNAATAITPLAAADTAITLSATGGAFRLKMLLRVDTADLSTSGQDFKLQFAQQSGTCDTTFSGETYADVTDTSVIAYNNNATPADGDNLTSDSDDPIDGGRTVVLQDYEELNNFTNSAAAITSGQDGLWDFSLKDNGAPASTAYCFKIVKSTPADLNTYTVVPQITTAASTSTEATIDATIHTTATRSKEQPALVFISDQVGYAFYSNSGNTCQYSKTSNGGTSWAAGVDIAAYACTSVGVWYDQWTPGDTTGTIVHMVLQDAGGHDIEYIQLNTSSDALSAADGPIMNNTAGASGVDNTAITKATDGDLYIGLNDNDGTNNVIKTCTGTCTTSTNWSAVGTSPLNATIQDHILLVPLASGSVMVIRDDITLEDIESNIWNGSTWAGWVDIDITAPDDNTDYFETISATVNKSTNDVYLVFVEDVALSTADVHTAVYNGSTWTTKTDAATNQAITNASIFIDQNNNNVYVAYLQGTVGSSMTAYYRLSTDGMATWGTATQFNTTTGDLRYVKLNMMSNERVYGTYIQNTNADLLGNTIADLSGQQSLTFSISDTGIGFGAISSSASRWATGNEAGATSETVAHTLVVATNATSGYSLTVNGATLACSACGGATVSAIGNIAVAPSAGSEQFGINLVYTGGSGTASSPYNDQTSPYTYAFDTGAFPDQIASSSGVSASTTYSVYYIGNITPTTEAGSYSATLTYIVTGTF